MNKKLDFQEGVINYSIAGQGQAVVLLHGFLESLNMWQEYSDHLQKEYRIITVDLPGHGETSVFYDTHSMGFMAEIVNHVLQEEAIHECIMIGHSMGGYVSLAFAAKFPKCIIGLGLFHSHAAADTEEARRNRDRTIHVVQNDHQGFISSFIPDLFAEQNKAAFQKEISALIRESKKTPKEGIIAALKGMKERENHFRLLQNATYPVLFIAGKKDKRIPTEAVSNQALMTQKGEFHILENVAHMGFIEAREHLLETIRFFIRKIIY